MIDASFCPDPANVSVRVGGHIFVSLCLLNWIFACRGDGWYGQGMPARLRSIIANTSSLEQCTFTTVPTCHSKLSTPHNEHIEIDNFNTKAGWLVLLAAN